MSECPPSAARSFATLAASAALILHGAAAAADAQVCAYLARGSKVAVLNTETNEVVANIPVTADDLALTADHRFAYVLGNGIAIIDTRKRRVTAAMPGLLAKFGESIAIRGDGRIAYVSRLNFNRPHREPLTRSLEVIDTVTGSLKRTIRNAGGDLLLSPDGAFLYATTGDNLDERNPNPPSASVINTRTRAVVSEIAGVGGGRIAISPDGRFAYLTGRELRVLDTETNTITRVIEAAGGSDVAVSPDGRFVYVAQGSALIAVDLATDTVDNIVSTDCCLGRIAITPDGHSAYISNGADGTLLVIDLAAHTITAELPGLATSSIVFASVPDGCTLPLPGDCNADGIVTVGELTTGVRMFLADTSTDECAALDRNANQRVTVDELLVAVDEALHPPGFDGPIRFGIVEPIASPDPARSGTFVLSIDTVQLFPCAGYTLSTDVHVEGLYIDVALLRVVPPAGACAGPPSPASAEIDLHLRHGFLGLSFRAQTVGSGHTLLVDSEHVTIDPFVRDPRDTFAVPYLWVIPRPDWRH